MQKIKENKRNISHIFLYFRFSTTSAPVNALIFWRSFIVPRHVINDCESYFNYEFKLSIWQKIAQSEKQRDPRYEKRQINNISNILFYICNIE